MRASNRSTPLRTSNDRLVGLVVLFVTLFGVLWVRCLWLQVVEAERLTAIAAAQHTATQRLRAQRGGIYDRHGRQLAQSLPAPSVYANARQVLDKAGLAERLAPIVKKDVAFVERRLRADRGFIWIARQVDGEVASAVSRFRRQGIGLVEEPKRFYPQQAVASHVLGFVNIDQDGLEGLELAYNRILQGEPGWQSTIRDAKGDLIFGPWTSETPPVDGYELILTMDSVVQNAAEEALAWGVEKYHALGGSVIVMEPETGALLAMANMPSFDANAPSAVPPAERRNRAVTDLLEPGSVFKVVTASALLEEQLITLDEKIFCEEGEFRTAGRHTLHDHRPHGTLSFQDVIRLSSNIGTAKAATRLPPDVFYHYIRAFGFGRRTGVDMPGEVSGMISPPARWSKLSPFIIPIGQEIAVTPLQLAVMTAVIANGGKRVSPYVVDRIVAPHGELVRAFPPATSERIVTSHTARAVETMLLHVVESGTGQLARVQGLMVAGKTGTAQKIEPNGRYSHSRYVASFVGYGPVPDPHVVIVVCVDEPRPVYFGGVVAAPIFKRLVEQLASYWELDRPAPQPLMARLS